MVFPVGQYAVKLSLLKAFYIDKNVDFKKYLLHVQVKKNTIAIQTIFIGVYYNNINSYFNMKHIINIETTVVESNFMYHIHSADV